VETIDPKKIKSVVSKSDGYQQCQLSSNLPKNMKILKFLKNQLAAATYANQEQHQNQCCCHCACSKVKSNKNNNVSKPPHNGIDESVGNFLTDCSSLKFGGATSKRLSATFGEPSRDHFSHPAFAQNLLDFAAAQHLQKVSKQNHHQHCQQRFVEPNQRICMKETRSVVRLVSACKEF
jgi:hypothetical protein